MRRKLGSIVDEFRQLHANTGKGLETQGNLITRVWGFFFARMHVSFGKTHAKRVIMSQRSSLPETASVAHDLTGGRMHAPSAARNVDMITALLTRYAPHQGRALELASGTGEHILAFARALPDLIWQPTEPDPDRRRSIDAWAATGSTNIRPAIALDATEPGWGARHPDQNLIVLVNLLHLIAARPAQTLIVETARALVPGARFILYGPFLRDGQTTSDGDAAFHASLRAHDPAIGYKDVAEVQHWLSDAGLKVMTTVDMPANNLTLISEKPKETPACA